VEPAPAHVDRLDLIGARGANGRVVAVADQEIVLDDAPQRAERQVMRDHWRAIGKLDVEHQPVAGDRQRKFVRPTLVTAGMERIVFQQVVDRDRTLMFDVGVGAAD